jgi:4-hydroxythreonine-4-phosphate dehydrogenase
MIYVTQGHENSISIEIFIKSFLLLNKSSQSKIKFLCFKESVIKTLKNIGVQYSLDENFIYFSEAKLDCYFLSDKSLPQSTVSLCKALELIQSKDVLITMPTSKDALTYNGNKTTGHTDFFRQHYKDNLINMNFWSESQRLLLLTEHINISSIESVLTSDFILNKITNSLNSYKDLGIKIESVYVAGINPHNGEGGLIGDDLKIFKPVFKELSLKFKKIKFHGPISGDSIGLMKPEANGLYVFPFHDQALSYFKSEFRYLGLNVTLGLPFLRLSVDHGTAFDLYGKNQANYMGNILLLKKSS